MKESDYQAKIIKHLKSKGAYVVKIQSASRSGIPDLLCCYKSRFLAIEVKTPTTMDNTSDLQELNIDFIRLAGGKAIVAYSKEQVDVILKEIDDSISTSN